MGTGPVRLPSGIAPGFRDAGLSGRLGAPMSIGEGGYSWASTVRGTFGMNLDFHMTGLSPSHAYCRAYGRQLRCLSE